MNLKCELWPIFRIDSLTKQYNELEDEFRMALQIESSRFKEVRTHISQVNIIVKVKWEMNGTIIVGNAAIFIARQM